MKKNTDNEIIKVAEQRLDEYQDMGYSHARELVIVAKRLLSANEKNERIIELSDKTIKAQSAEIERLEKARQKQAQFLGEERGQKYELINKITKAKSEAIKEFAERLTDKADLIKVNAFDSKWAISQDDIDNLLKEMVGDDNA